MKTEKQKITRTRNDDDDCVVAARPDGNNKVKDDTYNVDADDYCDYGYGYTTLTRNKQ